MKYYIVNGKKYYSIKQVARYEMLTSKLGKKINNKGTIWMIARLIGTVDARIKKVPVCLLSEEKIKYWNEHVLSKSYMDIAKDIHLTFGSQ